MRTHRKRRIIASAVTLGLIASIAVAAWLTEGVGDGRGKFGSLQAPERHRSNEPAQGDCYPGGNAPSGST